MSEARPIDDSPAALVRIEAAALDALAARLDDPAGPMQPAFQRAAQLAMEAVRSGHRVIVAGLGKSGLIARKIAATMVSTGTPAQFLHPAEALHGDLGILSRGDVLLMLSYSGETEELLRLLPLVPRLGVTLISFCGCVTSSLAKASDVTLDVSVSREACTLQLAPTASTTAMLALGDALALHVSRGLDFKAVDFAELHPGGQLGRRLATVGQLMHTGEAVPKVGPNATMPEIIHEMSARRLGLTTVQEAGVREAGVQGGGKLLGVISDGDLRRLFERDGPEAFHKTAATVMNRAPVTIAPEPLATDALMLMEERRITALIVTQDGNADSPLLGLLHLHDLWELTRPPGTPRR